MCTPFVGPYTATKFALNGFFGTMQHELAMKKSNVTVSICILGLIDTDSAMEKVRLAVSKLPNMLRSLLEYGTFQHIYYVIPHRIDIC